MNKQLVAACVAFLLGGHAAHAQSFTPMRGQVKSFAEEFALRVTVGNPYERTEQFDVRVYDENFQPVEALVSPSVLRVTPKNTRIVTVRVPFNGQPQRKVRVCAEGMFGADTQSAVRTQVCGRFLALHLGQ